MGTQKKKNLMWVWRQSLDDVSTSQGIPKIDGNYQKLGRKQGKDFSLSPQKERALLTPSSQASSLTHFETIRVFVCLSPKFMVFCWDNLNKLVQRLLPYLVYQPFWEFVELLSVFNHFLFQKIIYLSIFDHTESSSCFSLVAGRRGYSFVWCTGCSLWRLLLLQSAGSSVPGLQ